MLLSNRFTYKPIIENGLDYVVIGPIDHGLPLHIDAIKELIASLDGAVAMKVEGKEKMFQHIHPMSTETIAKASMGTKPVSYLPESDENDIGYYLLQCGVPEEIAGISIPRMFYKNNEDIPRNFFEILPVMFENYKERFSFINTERAVHNYLRVLDYWMRNKMDIFDLAESAYDFEKFMGKIREAKFWKSDLEKFRKEYSGKIAVCCGGYHTPFVKNILEGKPYEEHLDWEHHLEKRSERDYDRKITAEQLKEIYQHINAALGH